MHGGWRLGEAIAVFRDNPLYIEGLVNSARSMAHSMNATVTYLRSLPLAYRPLVLDQLRSMGGTRFVVSLNDKPLDMQVIYKAKSWLNKSRHQNATVRAYDLQSLNPVGNILNGKY